MWRCYLSRAVSPPTLLIALLRPVSSALITGFVLLTLLVSVSPTGLVPTVPTSQTPVPTHSPRSVLITPPVSLRTFLLYLLSRTPLPTTQPPDSSTSVGHPLTSATAPPPHTQETGQSINPFMSINPFINTVTSQYVLSIHWISYLHFLSYFHHYSYLRFLGSLW